MFKQIITTSLVTASTLCAVTANAALPDNLYLSGQVGYANTHMASKLPFDLTTENISNDGLAGRLAMGYKLNKNFALELGYLQLQTGKIKDYVGTLSLKQNAIDITGKGILPITNNVNVYGRLGLAYLTTTLRNKSTRGTFPVTFNLNALAGVAKHKWAPEVAIGMGYDITPAISVDTSLTHIHPIGSNRPGNIDFLAVGLTYNFC